MSIAGNKKMTMVQKKSKRRTLTCLSVIGALILAGAFVFIGCEEASPPSPPPPPSPIDRDGDRLIDIQNLDMLAHIRYNLAGTSYKTSEDDSGIKCGANSAVECVGYELMRDLDFFIASDYASGRHNRVWLPRTGNSVTTPARATNSGWQPIGSNAAPFAAIFEGNGWSISNLYSRNVENVNNSRFGLFGQLSADGTLRNLLIADSTIYGGSQRDHVGVAVGVNFGTIINVAVRGGSVHGGNGSDEVGGLAGYSNTVVASSSTALVYGGDGTNDNVGGLIGFNAANSTVTASYATGAVDGGKGNNDHVGGLVGRNHGIIRASYATGAVDGDMGAVDSVGGLVGLQHNNGTIIASYALGDVDGGADTEDHVGLLVGSDQSTSRPSITASYASGTKSGAETSFQPQHAPSDGVALPAGASTIAAMTMPVASASPPTSAAPAEWNQMSSSTLNAWDFGTNTQNPALRYADYDGNGGTDYCASFSALPGIKTAITCGTTLLLGQGRGNATSTPADLLVSLSADTNTILVSNASATPVTLTATVRNRQLARASTETTLTYYRSTDSTVSTATDTSVDTDAIPVLNGGEADTQNTTTLVPATVGNYYYYACVEAVANEANTSNNCSLATFVQVIPPVDSDNDTLIEIRNLDMLAHIRHKLDGTSYKTGAGDTGVEFQCGTDGTTACTGYELLRDLDFAVASDYAIGSVNMEWRPTAGNSIVAPDNATNRGWEPIGANPASFNTRFEGNGRSIRNLYIRNVANTNDSRFGLFGQLSGSASIRNFVIAESNVYGGRGRDHVGIAVGVNFGTISNVIVRGGSVHGGDGNDESGGLAGYSSNTIVASYSTAAAYGDGGNDDNVGGLVGNVDAGTVTASYATGAVDGGTGNDDHVGGLAGRNKGTIRASYARGDVNANDGNNEAAGGLVGLQDTNGTIIASYATGDADGGAGANDNVGQLSGNTSGTITASYGFGVTSGGEIAGNNGDTLPDGAGIIGQLTAPDASASPPSTAAPAEWQDAASHTMGAWDFGSATQLPALRYADYDGAGSTDYCASFTTIPGTDMAITCGTTLLSGQDTLRAVPPFDLTVSATADSNAVLVSTSITLTAIVRNSQFASASTGGTTLTYYHSADNVRGPATDTAVGTDTIPALNGVATDTQDMTIPAPATAGTYYYYACVAAGANEGDTSNNCSSVVTVQVVSPVDSDNDTLIEIRNLDMLAHIRHNLAGDSYKVSAGANGLQCGMDNATACTGYELMRDLDFAVASDYASGSVNMEWRPTADGSIVAPDEATNLGWEPIGTSDSVFFATLFEGNGYTLRNLYSRNTANTGARRTGLFGQLGPGSTLRNLLVEDGNVYGGSLNDHIGVAVGLNRSTISNVVVRGGSAHGGNDSDDVGGLVGFISSDGTIIASSSTAAAYGDDGGNDDVGGLVGENIGTITASYATGAVNGGGNNEDHVGGLVGNNQSTIRASYATGNVNANDGNSEAAGGLVGLQSASARIIASYATGAVDGGMGTNDNVGQLSGNNIGTITASYGFGVLSGNEVAGNDGDTLPGGAGSIGQLTIPDTSASPPTTAAPAEWQDASSHTMNAWDFGSATQLPVLRYADYDGSSSTDYCASFTNIPGTDMAITCGTTLLPGQEELRVAPPFDLTVSIPFDSNVVLADASFTLTVTVRNRPQIARSSTAGATLTYYQSEDNIISIATDTAIGTDDIPVIAGGRENAPDIAITAPATAGNYYYYACVAAGTNEADTSNNCSSVLTIHVITSRVDSDNDTLIEIRDLDMLAHIRYNLSGTSYKVSDGGNGFQCGMDNATACTGYELFRDLDFADAGSYASGSVNMEWRPMLRGSVVAPNRGANSGWQPIGPDDAAPFATRFEGNGNSISNLYSRNTANTGARHTGLFGQLNATGMLRNLLIADSNVYGGNNNDHVGVAVGLSRGTIINVAVRGGSAHGGNSSDDVGGLVGLSGGTIVASSSTAAVDGDAGNNDDVGGLVGEVNGGTVTASYASGAVDGGLNNDDHVGGLVGNNQGTVRASYARGNVNANDGNNEAAGGLVGRNQGTILASYATGNVDGGAGGNDNVGRLTGNTAGTVTASYASGTISGGEHVGSDGTALPNGAGTIVQLTMPVAANPPDTAVPAVWQDAASHTLNAWDFGTDTQTPALRYADYDGTGGTDYCALFSNIPGTGTAITCGTTPLSEQDTTLSVPPFDLTVSITAANVVAPSASLTLTATVQNMPFASTSESATLTYYSSTNNAISLTPTSHGTDTIPVLKGGKADTQDISVTAPAIAGSDAYYYACVEATNEMDTSNNCSDVLSIRVTDAFGLVAGRQTSEAFNFGIQLTDSAPLSGNQLVRQDGTWHAIITRPSALFNTGSELYMIGNTRDRGGSSATQATAQANVPEFYAFDTTNGRATIRGAFIGSASATTPGVVPYGAAVTGGNLYFVGEKQESSGAVGYLYRVPISSGRPTGLAIEVGTLALSMTATEDSPRGLAVAGGNLYLTSANGMLHTVRTDTGQITNSRMLQLGGSALPAADGLRLTSALTASSDGMLHAALMSGNSKNAELFSINPVNGVMTKTRDISLYIPGEASDRTTTNLTPTGLAYFGSRLYMVAQGASADISSITIRDEDNTRVAADKWLFAR